MQYLIQEGGRVVSERWGDKQAQGGGQATLISEATEWAHMRCVPGEGDNAGLSIWRRHATRVRAREPDGAATALDWLWGPLALASGAWLRFSE